MNHLVDLLSQSIATFLGIFIETLPFLLLGTFASGLVEVFFERADLARLWPRQPVWGALLGSLLGVFLPVSQCGVVPLARRFFQKGAPASVAISFLLAAPAVNPVVIASTYVAFGSGPVFWGRLGLTLVVAVLAGLVFSRQADIHEWVRESPTDEPEIEIEAKKVAAQLRIMQNGQHRDQLSYGLDAHIGSALAAPSVRERLRQAAVIAVDEFFEFGPYLVAGSLLAALIQTFLPQQTLTGIGRGPVLAVIVTALIAVLFSVSPTAGAFTASGLAGPLGSGAVLAFLVIGPMMDLKSILMLGRVFERRSLVYLVSFVLLLVLLLAAAWNLVLK